MHNHFIFLMKLSGSYKTRKRLCESPSGNVQFRSAPETNIAKDCAVSTTFESDAMENSKPFHHTTDAALKIQNGKVEKRLAAVALW